MTDERSKPAPGYLLFDTGCGRDRWEIGCDVPDCATEAEAIAATWEHADAVWESHPKTRKRARRFSELSAERDALRAEVERWKERWRDASEEAQGHLDELAQLRRDGCLGEDRTDTPDGPCWAWVEIDGVAFDDAGEGHPQTHRPWRWCVSLQEWEGYNGDGDEELCPARGVTRWWTIPEPKDGE